jgi:DNA-binding transcriptional LysR family regulator
MFNWSDIRFFLELARVQHLSRTAARLRVDVSTVSRRVAELERALKCKLFERTADGFALSEEGYKLLAFAERMEAAATEIASEVSDPLGRDIGNVRVATMEALATFVVAPEWASFRRDRSNIALELLIISQATNLGRREADISLTMFEVEAPRLVSDKIARFAVNLYASSQYLETHGHPKSTTDLANHVFIDYLDAFVAVPQLRWLREFSPDARIVFQSNSLIAQRQAAIAGVGIAALPAYAADRELVRLMPETTVWRDLWMTVHADTEYFSHVRAAVNFLKSRIPVVLDDANTG